MLGFPGTAASPASGGGAAGLASAAADAAAAMPPLEAVLRELAKGEAAVDHALTTAGTVLVLLGIVPAKGAPADIELPGVLNHGIKAAWDKSFPQGIEQEQGGILVITKAGTLEWRSGKPKGEAGQGEYSFTPNHQDIRGAEYVGFGHTHPYSNSAENSGPSAQDISLLFVNDRAGRWPPERMILVQSGNDQYLVARTAEFDQIIKPRDTGERTALAVGMERMYHRVMKQQQQAGATKAEQVDAAIKAVAQYYDLVYYKGTNGHLIKQ